MKHALTLIVMLFAVTFPARAQESYWRAWSPNYALNVRNGPGVMFMIIGALPPRAEVAIEGRAITGSRFEGWVLVRSGEVRGWVNAAYLTLDDGLALSDAPGTEEVIAPDDLAGLFAAVRGDDIPLQPVIPDFGGEKAESVRENVRRIAAWGRFRDNDPGAFTRVGDCTSARWRFLTPIAEGLFVLGPNYAHLQAVIDHFGDSFKRESQAAVIGYNAGSVLDPNWANPEICAPGESPLACEYRVTRPAIALIMFGTNDAIMKTPDVFEDNMRIIIEYTIRQGIVPVLSTIQAYETDPRVSPYVAENNAIIIALAEQYDVPLWNFRRAVEILPDGGLETDGAHVSPAGFWIRNLTTLQVLEAVWKVIQ